MKRSNFRILVPILALASCGEYECLNAQFTFSLIGFSSIETDTIILRKYTKTTNFLTALDTFRITPNNTRYSFTGDTLRFTAYSSDILMRSDFDYEISLPKAGKTFKLAKITEEKQSKKLSLFNDKVACINPIRSYELNGQLTSEENVFGILFLKK